MVSNLFDIQQLASGRVLPPAPFPYVGPGVAIERTDAAFNEAEVLGNAEGDSPVMNLLGTPMCMPLWMKLKSEADFWLLPVEPMITLAGGNTLVRRYVAKSKLRGSVKERWATDDYSISIEGVLTRYDELRYPHEDMRKLIGLLEAREPIDVKCQLLEYFGIGRIVIDKCEWPFTKGEENQAYRISAYSDDDWDLLIKQ